MKKYLSIMLCLFSVSLFSQKTFVNGYFIDNSGKKISCLINEEAWESNSNYLEYKATDSSKSQNANITEVSEYGGDHQFTVKRFDVQIDISVNGTKNLTRDRNLTYENKKVFLMELVDGKAKLYVYQNDNQLKFFYSYNFETPIQLEYKEYQYEIDILTNENYKQQLLNSFKNENVTEQDISILEYTKSSLINFFLKVNGKTIDEDAVNSKFHKNKMDFNLWLKGGVQSSSFYANSHSDFTGTFQFQNSTNVKYGFEVEFVLPYYSKKIAFFIEAYNLKYQDELTKSYGKVRIDYQTIEIPVGSRFYFYLDNSNKSKLFLDAAYQFSIVSKSDFKIENFQDAYSGFSYLPNFRFGFGYSFKNKFNITFNASTPRDLLSKQVMWTSSFKNYSLTFGYNLF